MDRKHVGFESISVKNYGGCSRMIRFIQYFHVLVLVLLFSYILPFLRPPARLSPFATHFDSIQHFDHVRPYYHKIRMLEIPKYFESMQRANTLMNDMHFTQI